MGWVSVAGGKTAKAVLDAAAAGGFFTRGIMLGSSALLAENSEYGQASLEGEALVDSMVMEWDVNDGRIATTMALSGTLFVVGQAWAMRRWVMQDRAKFVASMTQKIATLTLSIVDGSGYRQGLSDAIATIEAMKKWNTAEDFGSLSVHATQHSRQLMDLRSLYREFDDTFRALQYANSISALTEGGRVERGLTSAINVNVKTGQLIGATNSIFTTTEIGHLQKIAGSNQMFGQRQFGSNYGRTARAGARSLFNPLADKNLAMAAELFLPSEKVIDDVFNISHVLNDLRASISKSIDDIDNAVKLATNFTDELTRGVYGSAKYADEALKAKALLTIDAISGYANELHHTTEAIIDVVDSRMLPKIATARKAIESVFLRGVAKLAQGTSYVALRTGLTAAKSSSYAASVGTGVKVAGKVVGRLLLVDSVIWVATGLFDLAFVDDDGDSYLAEHWGFSPLGWLIDEAVDMAVPQEAQDAFAAGIEGAITAALATETLGGMVSTIIDFYINSIDITIIPIDFYEPQQIDLPFPMIIKDINPLDILVYALYGCVAKIVFKGWITPAWGYMVSNSPTA